MRGIYSFESEVAPWPECPQNSYRVSAAVNNRRCLQSKVSSWATATMWSVTERCETTQETNHGLIRFIENVCTKA